MNILALDMSLTSLGWAAYRVSTAGVAHEIESGSWKSSGRGWDRVRGIVAEVEDWVLEVVPDLVVIEGYSLGSKGNAVVSLGELGGALRWHLEVCGYTWVEVPPATTKKYASGKGNAPKALMMVEAVKRLGYEGHDEDEVDALWLLHCVLGQYQLPGAVEVPERHREFLSKVPWPELEALL